MLRIMTKAEASAAIATAVAREIQRAVDARRCESVKETASHVRPMAAEIQIATHRTPATRLVLPLVRAAFVSARKTDEGHTWADAGDAQSHGGRCYSHRERCTNCGATRRAYHDPDNAASGQPTRWYAKN